MASLERSTSGIVETHCLASNSSRRLGKALVSEARLPTASPDQVAVARWVATLGHSLIEPSLFSIARFSRSSPYRNLDLDPFC